MMDTNLESAKTVTRKWGKSLQKSCPGSLTSPMAKAVLAGIAAMVVKNVMRPRA